MLARLTASEAEFQQAVVDLARLHRWQVHHCHDSRTCLGAGLPDLILLRAGRLVFAELKTERGRLRQAQAEWLSLLSGIAGVQCFLWRPSDWADIEAILL